VAESFGEPECGWRGCVLDMFKTLLDEIGGKPGAKCPDLGNRIAPLVGGMLAVFPAAHRAELGRRIDVCREHAVCPALVGLLGPGSSGKKDRHSFAWPLLLPLAPYAEHIERLAEGTRADA
jgi:hypothetical protein